MKGYCTFEEISCAICTSYFPAVPKKKKNEREEEMEEKTNKSMNGLKNLGIGAIWSSRSFSLAADSMLLAFLTVYCGSSLGLDLGIIGTLLLAAKICDAVSNFVIAYIVDNTHWKLGKGRPWEICVIPMWLLTFVLFGIPVGWNTVLQYAMVFLIYVLIVSIFQTTLYCTEPIYFNHSFKDEKQRISVQTVNGFVNVVTFTLVGIVLPLLMGRYMGQPNGWMKISLIIGVPCMIIGMIRFICVKEVDIALAEQHQEKVSIKDTVQAIFGNKYVLMVTMLYFAVNLISGFANTANTYFFTYVLGNVELMSVINGFSMVAMLAIPLCPILARKISKSQIIILFMIIASIGCGIKLLAGANMVPLTIGCVLSGVMTYPIAVFGNLMLIDCMDYGEWKNGKRVEGAIFAGSSLGSTIGAGVGSALIGYIMNFVGFDGMAATQTEAALTGIKFTFAVLPAIIFIAAAAAMRFYKLDKEITGIRAELEARKK